MPAPTPECDYSDDSNGYVNFYFGLLVTGETEAEHLPKMFKSFGSVFSANYPFSCKFEVIRRIRQLSPQTSLKKHQGINIAGTKKIIPEKDITEISLPTRKYLRGIKRQCSYVILIDDLESFRACNQKYTPKDIFQRYRNALDSHLENNEKGRVSVHFMVNMLEAYYFADADAINQVLSTKLSDNSGDVEEIRHPKNDLKKYYPGFDEKKHGGKILEELNIQHVLGNPDTCASLRSLFQWIWQAIGCPQPDIYHCNNGKVWPVTSGQ